MGGARKAATAPGPKSKRDKVIGKPEQTTSQKDNDQNKRDKSRTPKDKQVEQTSDTIDNIRPEQDRYEAEVEKVLAGMDPKELAIDPITECLDRKKAGGFPTQQENLFNSGFLFGDTKGEKTYLLKQYSKISKYNTKIEILRIP